MISVVQLGIVPYAKALKLQQSLVALRKQSAVSNTLLLLEHSPVITLGRNAKREHVVATDEVLAKKGVELFECNRGGDVTFHGPGQLVGYPIFDLRGFTPHIGAVEFVRRMEEILIRTCTDFGISAMRVPGMTGVWTRNTNAKIAAIGVHISAGVTSHGFALNVTTDLDCFNLIVPCGISGKPVTSMSRVLGRGIDFDEVAHSAARNFGLVFNSQVLWVDTIDALLGRKVGVPVQQPPKIGSRGDDTTWA